MNNFCESGFEEDPGKISRWNLFSQSCSCLTRADVFNPYCLLSPTLITCISYVGWRGGGWWRREKNKTGVSESAGTSSNEIQKISGSPGPH